MIMQANCSPLRLYAGVGVKNFGDELSPYLIQKLTNCTIELTATDDKNKLVAIGSAINRDTLYTLSTFWGTGVKTDYESLSCPKFRMFPINRAIRILKGPIYFKQNRFYALRGPLSYEILINKAGVEPSKISKVYSDPAIILPYVYQPKPLPQRYSIGIILHHYQPGDVLKKLIEDKYSLKVKFISIFREGTQELESGIDEICSCDCIASTSLHGIILAHAYGVPALFMQDVLRPVDNGSTFKFYDYFKGTNQEAHEPFKFSSYEELIPQLYKQKFIEAPNFRQLCQNLLDVFPYPDRLQLKNLPY